MTQASLYQEAIDMLRRIDEGIGDTSYSSKRDAKENTILNDLLEWSFIKKSKTPECFELTNKGSNVLTYFDHGNHRGTIPYIFIKPRNE